MPRKSCRIGLWAIGLWFFLLTALEVGRVAAASDPWYEDVHSSLWAYPEIRLLWEEECSDGWLFTRRRRDAWGKWHEREYALFGPNDPMSRGEYAMLLAKTFRLQPADERGPTFSDVPPDFCLYRNKPAYGYIEAGAAQGWLRGTGEGRFLPEEEIARDHAVALLIRALGLQSFARDLAEEAQRYLHRFPDGHLVDPSVRAEVALAIRLRILRGYDDGYLYPRHTLLRCQGAALLSRCAMVDVTADPPRLSPDGDGAEDVARFLFRTLKNRGTANWNLTIGNLEGQWYRSFYPGGKAGEPPQPLTWDGTSDEGVFLPDGTYYYQAWIRDRQNHLFCSALKPLRLERRRLWGSLSPTEISPGGTVTIKAGTTGGALRVTASAEEQTVELSPSQPPREEGGNSWQGSLLSFPEAEAGGKTVRVVAYFPSTTRTLDLQYYVRDPLALSGKLEPNPSRAGERVRVWAYTSPSATSVRAHLPWGDTLSLQRQAPATWSAFFRTHPETADGSYPVTLEAQAGSRRKELTLLLFIEDSLLSDLAFSLTE